jgi:ABC-type transporter Mla subunit MlaD
MSHAPVSAPVPRRERLLFLGSGLVMASALLLGLAREQHWGERFVTLQLRSSNAEGLRSGQEVRISGIPVGQVSQLQLQSDAQVLVTVQVRQRYAGLIGPRSSARLAQEGLVGERFLQISADPRRGIAEAAHNGQRLPFEQPVPLHNLVERLVATQAELQRTLQNTTRLTATELPQTLQDIRRGLQGAGQLSRTLERETQATAPQLRQTLQQLQTTGNSAEQTSRQAQQLLQQSQPLVIRNLQELETLTQRLNRVLKGLLGLSGSEPAEAEPAPKP